ncbi:MAG: mechanosensitive ion channel [Candidatus Magasanikbacteria bacterium]|nr:mechanosensitive ion channel [Candidatus Magasanikbacteria bacterium]
MSKKIVNIIILTIISGLLWYIDFLYPNDLIRRILLTSVYFLLLYFLFTFFLTGFVSKRIKDYKLRYSFKKIANILFFITITAVVIRIWIEDPQTLLVSYGLIAAGVAIALQDFFKNFIGGVLIIVNSLFKVGDRIEIKGKYGDVIDIGILYTTLLEIKGWVDGDQATGRVTRIPNGAVLTENINNYTEDHGFIWDEIFIPVTYESNWQDAIKKVLAIVKKETKSTLDLAKKDFKKLRRKYFVGEKVIEPIIFVKMTDNWIELHVRYITEVKQRRNMHNVLSQKILKKLSSEKNISVASATLGIVDIPPIKLKK